MLVGPSVPSSWQRVSGSESPDSEPKIRFSLGGMFRFVDSLNPSRELGGRGCGYLWVWCLTLERVGWQL